MDENIYQTLIDMMFYYRSGSYILFKRILLKVLDYHNIKLDDADINKACRIIIRRLSEFNIIEVYNGEQGLKWVITNNTILKVNDGYILHGDSKFIKTISTSFGGSSEFFSYQMKAIKGLKFEIVNNYITLNNNDLATLEIFDICEVNTRNYMDDWTIYPDINTVIKAVSESSSTEILYGNYDIRIFDFSKSTWESDYSSSHIEIGLYRVRDKYGKQIFLIIYEEEDALRAIQLRHFDWVFLISTNKLRKTFVVNYDERNQVLSFNAAYFGLLPLILRRLLVLQSYVWPSKTSDNYLFSKIRRELISYVSKLYPSMKVIR